VTLTIKGEEKSNILSSLTSTIQPTCSSVEAGEDGEKEEEESLLQGRMNA